MEIPENKIRIIHLISSEERRLVHEFLDSVYPDLPHIGMHLSTLPSAPGGNFMKCHDLYTKVDYHPGTKSNWRAYYTGNCPLCALPHTFSVEPHFGRYETAPEKVYVKCSNYKCGCSQVEATYHQGWVDPGYYGGSCSRCGDTPDYQKFQHNVLVIGDYFKNYTRKKREPRSEVDQGRVQQILSQAPTFLVDAPEKSIRKSALTEYFMTTMN